MSDVKIQQSLHNLENAVERLREALVIDRHAPLAIDGTIQRFEFVIELFWKTLQRLLQYEAIEAKAPREALKQAYRTGWLDNETAWLQMLKDRNETSHIYDEDKAEEIYQHIQDNFPEIEKTFLFLKKRFAKV